MGRIAEITPAQIDRFGEWARRWIEIGLSTEPADFDRASEAALRAYALCNLAKPMIVLRMSSPYGATLGGVIAWAMLQEIAGTRSQVWSQVRSQVWSQVRSQVRSQVWSQVGSQVWSQVDGAFFNDRGGAFWAGWGAYVSYMRDVLGWADPVLERFEIDETLIQSCGWVWWHENILAISDRPSIVNRDEQGRLHSDSGPSIAYRDGWALHHWHGVLVEPQIILDPHTITPTQIDAEQNAEVRRVLIDRYRAREEINGAAAYTRDAGGHRIDYDERFGTLWRRDVSGDEPIVMVEVVNSTPEQDGSRKRYWLRVDPQIRPLMADGKFGEPQTPTALNAVASTFGMTGAQYAPTVET